MMFSLENLISSIAVMLDNAFGLPVYVDTNQQSTDYPCFFIFLVNPSIDDEIDRRRFRNIGIDVVYVQQRNMPDIDSNNTAMIDALDELLDTITYSNDDDETAILHCYEHSAHVTDDDLHYQFRVKIHVTTPIDRNPMQEIESANVNVEGD
jgi:hypothetical protein